MLRRLITVARTLILSGALCLSAHAKDLDEMLGKPKPDRYELPDGGVVTVIRTAGHDTLKAGDGQVISELTQNEVVAQSVQSPNKRFLLCLLRTHRGAVEIKPGSTSLGYDFSGLARISHNPAGWIFQRVRTAGDRIDYVRELGALSNDGVRALLRIGRKSAPAAPYSMEDYWETWDLDRNLLISKGLTVD
jgi:hypothetical protein